MAEYVHLIGAEQVQAAAGTFSAAVDEFGRRAGWHAEALGEHAHKMEELVERMERIAETWALLADKFPTASKAEECAGEIAMARHILFTRSELSEQHRAALAQIERWRPVVEAAERQTTGADRREFLRVAACRASTHADIWDHGVSVHDHADLCTATEQTVRAMRAQAKESGDAR